MRSKENIIQISGFAGLASLIGVTFLLIVTIVGTNLANNKEISLSPNKEAKEVEINAGKTTTTKTATAKPTTTPFCQQNVCIAECSAKGQLGSCENNTCRCSDPPPKEQVTPPKATSTPIPCQQNVCIAECSAKGQLGSCEGNSCRCSDPPPKEEITPPKATNTPTPTPIPCQQNVCSAMCGSKGQVGVCENNECKCSASPSPVPKITKPTCVNEGGTTTDDSLCCSGLSKTNCTYQGGHTFCVCRNTPIPVNKCKEGKINLKYQCGHNIPGYGPYTVVYQYQKEDCSIIELPEYSKECEEKAIKTAASVGQTCKTDADCNGGYCFNESENIGQLDLLNIGNTCHAQSSGDTLKAYYEGQVDTAKTVAAGYTLPVIGYATVWNPQVTGAIAGWLDITTGTAVCVKDPYSDACAAYIAAIQGDPTALIQLANLSDDLINTRRIASNVRYDYYENDPYYTYQQYVEAYGQPPSVIQTVKNPNDLYDFQELGIETANNLTNQNITNTLRSINNQDGVNLKVISRSEMESMFGEGTVGTCVNGQCGGLLGIRPKRTATVYMLDPEDTAAIYNEYGNTVSQNEAITIAIQKACHEGGHACDWVKYGISDPWATEYRQKLFNATFYDSIGESSVAQQYWDFLNIVNSASDVRYIPGQ